MFYFDHRLQTVFIETASEKEIFTFLAVMKTKTRDEAKELVDELANRIIEKM